MQRHDAYSRVPKEPTHPPRRNKARKPVGISQPMTTQLLSHPQIVTTFRAGRKRIGARQIGPGTYPSPRNSPTRLREEPYFHVGRLDCQCVFRSKVDVFLRHCPCQAQRERKRASLTRNNSVKMSKGIVRCLWGMLWQVWALREIPFLWGTLYGTIASTNQGAVFASLHTQEFLRIRKRLG